MSVERRASLVKAFDVCHVRFAIPDLAKMERFLDDFGMAKVSSTADALFMRGTGAAPFLYHAQRSDQPGFTATGLRLLSVEDLHRVARHDGVAVEPLEAPGGGYCARFVDPDGFVVEAVAGQALREPERFPALPWNEGGDVARRASFRRVRKGPSQVMRLGHVVFCVADFARSEAWYKERFGFVTSDEVRNDEGQVIAAFLRCDRGEQTCDHHTIFLAQFARPVGYLHAAYEVHGLDDLLAGHEFMKQAGHSHYWGIGRHLLGSQVFDYWLDPWGHQLEHWTDGDQLAAKDGGGEAGIPELLAVQWGPERPSPTPQ